MTEMKNNDLIDEAEGQSNTGLRYQLYVLLEEHDEDRFGFIKNLDIILSLLLLLSLSNVIFATEKELYLKYPLYFKISEIMTCLVFSIEYLLRLWICVEDEHLYGKTSLEKRIKFAKTPMMIVDLLGLLPFLLVFFNQDNILIFTLFTFFRIFRFFKLTRYSNSMTSLLKVILDEKRTLLSCLLLILGLLLIASTSLYLIERDLQPDKFGSIPKAIWWSVVTFGTIGYGDVVPASVLGKTITSIFVLIGVPIFALPVGIIATAYNQEINKREFVVTWAMLAKVPIFSKLTPHEISEIMPLLYSKKYERNEMICQKGEQANEMFFIVNGKVEIQLDHKIIILSTGDFFGEMSLIEKKTRQNTVVALVPTKTLLINAIDFESLLKKNSAIAHSIKAIAKERAKITEEELKHHSLGEAKNIIL